MRISCVQMDMRLGEPEENFAHAAALLRQAAAVQEKPDVLVLPETWNTGFFPAQDLANLADDDGRQADHNRALAHHHVRVLLALAHQRAGKAHQTIADHQAQKFGPLGVHAQGADHILVVAGSADGAADLRSEKPVEQGHHCDSRPDADQLGSLGLGEAGALRQ